MIGISVYIGLEEYPQKENEAYIRLAHRLGIRHIFTSAHIPEMHASYIDELKEILTLTTELNMYVSLDLSKEVSNRIDLNNYNVHTLRLDYGFSNGEIVELSTCSTYNIELNASTLNEQRLISLIKMGLNIEQVSVSHNYYPKRYTGLDYKTFNQKNEYYKQHGLTIKAFIPSQFGKRGPIYEGLPTVERHRSLNLTIAIQELVQANVDLIYFGDAYASEQELIEAINLRTDVIAFQVKLADKISDLEYSIVKQRHVNRLDESQYFKRSSRYRCTDQTIEPHNTTERKQYSVTIDNKHYKRYQGELQIIKKDLEADPKVNVVGTLLNCEYLLDCLKPGMPFEFNIVKKDDDL
ncbi:MupG family TIM beta-alpha barrel fold protein [Haloplasma contractile]|uniref:Outer surface protein n=1 Tax=Haloplasma contractile SSD-17B TaxID=1033810 RepID=F7PUD1_9MOLU|nr:MupG family TIM beta-alpha barrel fold protein [Haloplasma contractile]ERJ11745.1 Outer surface protein [Haloplasma contractile SSD-17B]